MLVANKFGASLINQAVSGGTNERTLYHTVKNINQDFDLYLIAWSEYSRFTCYRADNNAEVNFNIHLKHTMYEHDPAYSTWGKTYYTTWYNELFAFKLWLQQIIQLQALFEKNQKQYLMINTMSNQLDRWLVGKDDFIASVNRMINVDIMNDDQIFAEWQEIQYYVEQIDTTKFYQWNQFFIKELSTKFECGPNTHILEKGHEYLADIIYKHLCSK